MSPPIHVRLIFWYTILIVFTSASFGVYTYSSLQHRLYEEMQEILSRRLRHMRADVLPNISDYPREALAKKIEEVYSPEANERFIRVSKTDGTVLYISGRPREQTFDPALIPLPHDYTSQTEARMEGERVSERIMLVGFVSDISGSPYILEMGAPIKPITNALHRLVVTLLIGLSVTVIIAVWGGSFLVRRALEPVEAMRATAEQITFSNLRQRLPTVTAADAIGNLSRTLNQMLDRLDQAYQQASRFSADASHELRTPLTIMHSELEAVLHDQDMTVRLRESIGSILEESEYLSGIVGGLFALARLEAGEAKIEHKTFDLAELARSTLDQMQLLAEEKHQSVTIAASHPVFVTGDAIRLKRVIANLFDNATKYTMDGGKIALSVQATASKAVLTVKDNGIGISSDVAPHVFERFYRADKARSRASQGAGLGLSIVQAICQAHGGTVRLQSEEGVGTTVTVELPMS